MRRVTTTNKIKIALNEGKLKVAKVEVYYKTFRKTEIMDSDSFKESLDFFCKSGIFANALGWHYGTDTKTNGYIAETGRMNPDTEIIIRVYLDVCNGVKTEDVDEVLRIVEEEYSNEWI